MSVLLAAFAVTGRADMRDGTLLVWWRIIAVGLVVTVAGTAGFVVSNRRGAALQALALFGWILLPAAGFVDTGRRVENRRGVYFGGVAGCVLRAVLYRRYEATAPG
jgi:hypothetical protein